MTEIIEERQIIYNVELERALLGRFLVNDVDFLEISEFLSPKHFYDNLHRDIFAAMLEISSKNISISSILLKDFFDEKILAELLGLEYRVEPGSVKKYAHIIVDLAKKRQLLETCEMTSKEILQSAKTSNGVLNCEELIDLHEKRLFEVTSKEARERHIAVYISKTKAIESILYPSKDKFSLVKSCYTGLDRLIKGFRKGTLNVIAARPSMGKTDFALNIAINATNSMTKIAEDSNENTPIVAFFSLEMAEMEIAFRLLSLQSKKDMSFFSDSELTKSDENLLREVYLKTLDNKEKMVIDYSSNVTSSIIRSRARRLKHKENLGLLIIDYLQLMRSTEKFENANIRIGSILQDLKLTAKELDIPIILLSQLNREVEKRVDKRPILADLRDSGSIEQDADIVMFLHREEYYLNMKKPPIGTSEYIEWQKEFDSCKNIAEITVAKNRNGETGSIKLRYKPHIHEFSNL